MINGCLNFAIVPFKTVKVLWRNLGQRVYSSSIAGYTIKIVPTIPGTKSWHRAGARRVMLVASSCSSCRARQLPRGQASRLATARRRGSRCASCVMLLLLHASPTACNTTCLRLGALAVCGNCHGTLYRNSTTHSDHENCERSLPGVLGRMCQGVENIKCVRRESSAEGCRSLYMSKLFFFIDS